MKKILLKIITAASVGKCNANSCTFLFWGHSHQLHHQMVAPVLLLYSNSQSPERKSAHIKYGWRVHHNIIYWWPDGDIVATDCAAIIISVVVETAEICSQSGSAGILNALAVAPTSYPSHHWDTRGSGMTWTGPELPPHMICPKSQPSLLLLVMVKSDDWCDCVSSTPPYMHINWSLVC